ncbi:MAG: hypothetical protein IPG23_00430 [Burkholderiales bacterium]|jgi:hypothetical protein|nr:hypothetical protein [Burkholderiales bacterium]
MKPLASFGIVFIAVIVVATGAAGQSVYRCGNTYSEKPCTDGVAVNVQDSRTPAQKRESDAATRRDVATTEALEQAKQREMAQSNKSSTEFNKSAARTSPAKTKAANSQATRAEGNNKEPGTSPARKKKDSEYFTARTVAPKPASKASASARK